MTVESICRSIRHFPTLRPLAYEYSITILCDRNQEVRDSIDIAVVSFAEISIYFPLKVLIKAMHCNAFKLNLITEYCIHIYGTQFQVFGNIIIVFFSIFSRV